MLRLHKVPTPKRSLHYGRDDRLVVILRHLPCNSRHSTLPSWALHFVILSEAEGSPAACCVFIRCQAQTDPSTTVGMTGCCILRPYLQPRHSTLSSWALHFVILSEAEGSPAACCVFIRCQAQTDPSTTVGMTGCCILRRLPCNLGLYFVILGTLLCHPERSRRISYYVAPNLLLAQSLIKPYSRSDKASSSKGLSTSGS